MPFTPFILITTLAIAPNAAPAPPNQSASTMVADQWVRTGKALLESSEVTVDRLRAGTLIGEMAVELAPESENAWRYLLALADVGEQPELQRQAVQKLAELDPRDEVIRLRRLSHVIDDLDTAEERVAMYERLLEPARRDEIGPAVASRLALDLAMLKQSQGEIDDFAKWLAEATAIDASNRRAAALAAGYFRDNVDDPAAEAELLVSLVMADPTDAMSMLSLAQLLLEHGAYDGGERMYRQSLKVAAYTGMPRITDELVADAAIAIWGQGDEAGALRLILEHQRFMDQLVRFRKKQENPDLTPLDLAKERAMLSPTLASVRAMIQERMGGETAVQALNEAIASYDAAITAASSTDPVDPAVQARLLLEQASVMYWLGGNVEEAASRVAQAGDLQPLTAEAQARFDGWRALRSGDAAAARQILQPLAADDALAAIGFALALIEEGETKESARQLLAVIRRQPGTLLGVWAYDTLAEMLGKRFTVSETAAALDQVIDAIPPSFDRFVDDPTLALSLRITPTKVNYEPFEPVILKLEIRNHTNVPLSIDRDGPIRPHIALLMSPQVARVKLPTELRPMIVDIDRRLRIPAHERMEIEIDLRNSQLATVLDTQAIRGATVSVRGLINFMITPQGALRAGLLGSELMTERLRIDGVRISRDWLQDVIAAVMEPDSLDDLIQLALIAPVAAVGPAEGAGPEDQQLLQDAFTALLDAFPKLKPVEQAWLLGVIPRTASMEPIREQARRSTDPVVQLSYLIHQSAGASDPVFDAAQRGEHAKLPELAQLLRREFERAAASGQGQPQQ